jgi:hypothetical protein
MTNSDPANIRSKIDNYIEDRPLQMLFKAVYLLGAKECEMLGEKYSSDKSGIYGPTGIDSWEESVSVQGNEVNAVLFRIKTSRMRGKKDERIVWLPRDCEPWAEDLFHYFRERGAEKVFPFKRMKIRDKVTQSKVLGGLEKPVTYTGEKKWNRWRLDELIDVRKRELEEKFGFKEAHLKAYGIKKINKLRPPDNLLDDSRLNELRKEYLLLLCNPKTEEKDTNILFVDGKRIDVEDLIENHETEKTELKSSLCYDYDKKNKFWVPEMAVAKAVASFLNSDGGFVLIGVKDDKTILGLEKDFEAIHTTTEDAFELHFTTVIGNYLGFENTTYVKIRFTKKEGKKIAVVVIPKQAPREVFLTENKTPHFYIRSGNSSRELNVKEAIEYVRQHWKIKVKLTL